MLYRSVYPTVRNWSLQPFLIASSTMYPVQRSPLSSHRIPLFSLFFHAVAKTAKALGQKLKLQQKEDSGDEGDQEGADKDADRLWGANKRAYYDADNQEVRVFLVFQLQSLPHAVTTGSWDPAVAMCLSDVTRQLGTARLLRGSNEAAASAAAPWPCGSCLPCCTRAVLQQVTDNAFTQTTTCQQQHLLRHVCVQERNEQAPCEGRT